MNISEFKAILNEKEYGTYKFVLVIGQEDQEYRFCEVMTNHSSLVSPGERAIAAGTFGFVDPKNIKIIDYRSMTLGIGSDNDDWRRLGEALNVSVLNRLGEYVWENRRDPHS